MARPALGKDTLSIRCAQDLSYGTLPILSVALLTLSVALLTLVAAPSPPPALQGSPRLPRTHSSAPVALQLEGGPEVGRRGGSAGPLDQLELRLAQCLGGPHTGRQLGIEAIHQIGGVLIIDAP